MTDNPFPGDKPTIPNVPTAIFPSENPMEKAEGENPLSQAISSLKADKSSETVKVVEKVSGILSPYFVVLVGLFVYDNNFFLGTILIVVGILSLLKITWTDVNQFFDKIKSLLNSNSGDDEAF
jgi:hypothetical protein